MAIAGVVNPVGAVARQMSMMKIYQPPLRSPRNPSRSKGFKEIAVVASNWFI